MKLRILILTVSLLLGACMKVSGDLQKPQAQGITGDSATNCAGCTKGNEQGNASDYYSWDAGSAWFVGSKKQIRYCIEVSSSFGISQGEASLSVASAFDRWQKYIDKKKINDATSGSSQLAVNLTSLARCDGSEDLAFYFGIQNDKTKLYQNQVTGRVASAVRTEYDIKKAWGKGFIWVASQDSLSVEQQKPGEKYPDWTLSYNLSGILTHELGHVYGVGHVDGTIMEKDTANRLRIDEERIRMRYLGSIDADKELVICEACDLNLNGALGYYETSADAQGVMVDDSVSEAFKILTGSVPQGGYEAVKARLVGHIQSGLILEVSDQVRTFNFPVAFDINSQSKYLDSTEVFKVITPTSGEGSMMSRRFHEGYSENGTLTTQSGNILNVTLERNMQSPNSLMATFGSPFIIRYLVNGKIKPLFIVPASELNKPL